MKVGAGRIDITPKEPFYLLGYKTPLRNKPAEGIHDHIYLNGVLLCNDSNQQIFIATGDLLELEDKFTANIRNLISQRYDIAFENIIIGVTHDHHSVRDYHENWEYGKFDQGYHDFLQESFVELFEKCQADLTTVEAKYGADFVYGYYGNRNHPGQPADNMISIIKFVNKDRIVASIINLAVHSTVLSGTNMQLTADLAGNISNKLFDEWGCYPLMLIGCAGDSSNHNERLGNDFAELERVSAGIAQEIKKIKLDQKLELDNQPLRGITLAQAIISDKKSYDQELRKNIKDLQQGKLKIVGAQPVEHVIAKCKAQLKAEQFYDLIAMQILDLGELRIFVFPGELASIGGKLLRASTQKTVLIAGYSNGFHHYFLEQKDYGLSFETLGNPVPAGTFEKIINKFCFASRLLDLK